MSSLHPSIQAILKHFSYDHLPPHLKAVSRPLCQLAESLVGDLGSDPEVTAGLRKLLEAKDCFVRARVAKDSIESAEILD